MSQDSTRLNKYISESGLCSRREADRFIEQGNVQINGKRAKIGDQVFPKDRVMVNGQIIEPREIDEQIFLAFNKPVGVTSTSEPGVRDNIVEYVNHSSRIFPIGRLDKDSQGLIFLTNNGDIVNKILRASNNHEKEYLVTVDKPISPQFVSEMSAGVPILGVMTKKCLVSQESPFVFRIVLVQGMNRQIRRMCEHFGYAVTKLERVRIMNVKLKGLPLGEWRELTPEEMLGINQLIQRSTSDGKPEAREKKKKVQKSFEEPVDTRRPKLSKVEKSFKKSSEAAREKEKPKTKIREKSKGPKSGKLSRPGSPVKSRSRGATRPQKGNSGTRGKRR